LIQAGRNVILSDIDPQRRDIMRLDFLNDDPPPATRGSILITNPPFNIIDEFCERALQLLDAGHLKAVVLLYRADKANTQERIEAFNRAAYELTITARTKWIPGNGSTEKSPRWWFSWITWLAGKNGPPVNRRINRAELDPLDTDIATGNAVCGNCRQDDPPWERRTSRQPLARTKRRLPGPCQDASATP
jgi:hypothetical protein